MPIVFRLARATDLVRVDELVVRSINDLLCGALAYFDPLSLPETNSGRIGGAIRPKLAQPIYDRMTQWRAKQASPCPKTGAFGCDCNNRHKLEADAEDAARQTPGYGQGTPVGSTRSASHNNHFAMVTVAPLADPECPSPEPAG